MNNDNLLRQQIQQNINLPVLPSGISYLLSVLNNNDIGYTELADRLEKFPSIAIKIVAIANSAWAAPVSPITTLREACARVGVQVVRSISIALTVAQVFDPTRCPAFDAKAFWVSSLFTAEAAHICANQESDICPGTARLAGLLHSIGLLWLATQCPQETSAAINLHKSNSDYTLSEALIEQLGMDFYTAGGYLVSAIDMPEILSAVIASPSLSVNQSTGDSLINNHRHAVRLTTAILESEPENDEERTQIDDPCYEPLIRKLSGIESMAQTLFSH